MVKQDNLEPTAEVYGDIYAQAGSPKAVRGGVTNVSNYNPVRPPPTPSTPEPLNPQMS